MTDSAHAFTDVTTGPGRARSRPHVVCAVGGHADDLFRLRAPAVTGQSVPSDVATSAGGCALNVAAGLAGLGARVTHAGLRGDDAAGELVAAALAAHGVVDAALVVPGKATGRYAAMVEPNGTLALAAAAMGIYDHAARLADHAPFGEAARDADALLLDANGPPGAAEVMAARLNAPGRTAPDRGTLALLATSTRKAPVLAALVARADVVFANEAEWAVLPDPASVPLAFVTRGADGAWALRRGETVAEAAPPPGPLVDVVGGGDAFAAGALLAHLEGAEPGDALARGLACAARSVAHEGALGWLETA